MTLTHIQSCCVRGRGAGCDDDREDVEPTIKLGELSEAADARGEDPGINRTSDRR